MVARIACCLLLVQIALAALLGLGFKSLWPALHWLAVFLIGMSCVLITRALIVANNFRLAAFAAFPDTATTTPALDIRSVLRLYISELTATLVSSSWTMPFSRPRAFVFNDSAVLPVLLIHGYGCNGGYWRALSKQLQAARITHNAIDLEPILCGIECYLPQLTIAIDRLQSLTGQRQIVIVAHSMGGLVARAWVNDHGSEHIAKLITLGTPHGGTILARYGPGHNARQMLPLNRVDRTSWLARLNMATNVTVPIVSIYSIHDNIVVPSASSHLHTAKNSALTGIGHVALCSHPEVMSLVIEEISSALATNS